MKKYRFDADLCGLCVSKGIRFPPARSGTKVNCWTIDTPEDAEKLIGMGVDFITSNIP